MQLSDPSPQVVTAVQAGILWLKSATIYGKNWSGGRDSSSGRMLVAAPGASPLWSRYYSITTGRPIFGDRDKTIHDDVNEITLERRNGYQWFGSGPQKALAAYTTWSKHHSPSSQAIP